MRNSTRRTAELPDREVMSIVPVGPDPLLIDPSDQPVGTDPTLDESGSEHPTDQSSGAGS